MNALSVEKDSDDEKERNQNDSEDEEDEPKNNDDSISSIIATSHVTFDSEHSCDQKRYIHIFY